MISRRGMTAMKKIRKYLEMDLLKMRMIVMMAMVMAKYELTSWFQSYIC